MFRFFELLINGIYWLWIFIVPILIFGGIGFFLYLKSPENLPFAIILTVIAVVLGFLWAERVRKKEGLTDFFGRISSHPKFRKKESEKKDSLKQ